MQTRIIPCHGFVPSTIVIYDNINAYVMCFERGGTRWESRGMQKRFVEVKSCLCEDESVNENNSPLFLFFFSDKGRIFPWKMCLSNVPNPHDKEFNPNLLGYSRRPCRPRKRPFHFVAPFLSRTLRSVHCDQLALSCRVKVYKSDWTDGFNRKSLPAIMFLYFACLLPAVAFGGIATQVCS